MESRRFDDFEGRQAKNEKSLAVLRVLLLIWGIYCIVDLVVVVGMGVFLLPRIDMDRLLESFRQALPFYPPQFLLISIIAGTVLGLGLLVLNGIAALCAARLIRLRTKWQQALYWLMALLVQVPFGILVGVYGILLLNRKDIKMLFDAPPTRPIGDQWTMPRL